MPWTPKQIALLLSKVSPLSETEKKNMKRELHEDPELGHAEKKRDVESHQFDWRKRGRK